MGAGRLSDEMVDAASITAPFGLYRDVVPATAPSNYAPVTASCDVAPATAPSKDALVTALCDVVSVVAPGIDASVTASCDFVPVSSSATTLSALPPPIPGLLTFLPSPLAFSAFVPQSLSTPASFVVSGATLQLLRNRLARHDAKYTDPKDRFVAREADLERLSADMQSLPEQVTAL